MQLDAVLFDMDGTLLDSAPDFVAVTQQMLKAKGFPAVEDNKIRQVISGGAAAMIAAAFNIERAHPEFESLRLEFLELYLKNCANNSRLFQGVDSLLKTLEQANIKWGIVTNKPVRFAHIIMQRLNLAERCAVLVCPEHVTHCKPSPEPLLLAATQLQISSENIIYVGDDQRDIEAGNAAGCRTIAVNYGYIEATDNPHNWGAGAVVETPEALKTVIDNAICGC